MGKGGRAPGAPVAVANVRDRIVRGAGRGGGGGLGGRGTARATARTRDAVVDLRDTTTSRDRPSPSVSVACLHASLSLRLQPGVATPRNPQNSRKRHRAKDTLRCTLACIALRIASPLPRRIMLALVLPCIAAFSPALKAGANMRPAISHSSQHWRPAVPARANTAMVLGTCATTPATTHKPNSWRCPAHPYLPIPRPTDAVDLPMLMLAKSEFDELMEEHTWCTPQTVHLPH